MNGEGAVWRMDGTSSTEGNVVCPHCRYPNSLGAILCVNCQQALIPTETTAKAKPDVIPAVNSVLTTEYPSSATTVGRQVNVIDAATGSTNKIIYAQTHVEIQSGATLNEQNVYHTTPHNPLTIDPGSQHRLAIHPQFKAEMSLSVTIGEGSHVYNTVFSPQDLSIRTGATIGGSVYAGGVVEMAQRSAMRSNLFALGDIRLGNNASVEGIIMCINGKVVQLGNNCNVGGIISNGDVTIGDNCTAAIIKTLGNVITGSHCKVTEIQAQSVQLGDETESDTIDAIGDLNLSNSVRIGRCRIGGTFGFGDNVQINKMDTICANGLAQQAKFPLLLAGKPLTENNVFDLNGRQLNIHQKSNPGNNGLVVLTQLLDADLFASISQATQVRASGQ